MKDIKLVYVLLDGIGDLPHSSLNGLTPLEAAYTPNLDALARNGAMGSVLSVGKGIAPQSDIAVFNMLGYNFKDGSYVGRGVIESIGCNIDFREGDLALRGNFATVDNNLKIVDRRAGRAISTEEAKSVCKTLSDNITLSDKSGSVTLEPTIAHRVVIRFRHAKMKLSDKITNTDPAYDKVDGMGIAKAVTNQDIYIQESKAQEDIEPAKVAARMLNMSIGGIVDMPVEIGISKVLGIKMFQAGDIIDYEKKAKVAADGLKLVNAIYVHIKGPDEFGHDGNASGKKKNIEDIDRRFFGTLMRELNKMDAAIVISGDHSTPCIKKGHSDDPVPLLVSSSRVEHDGSARFTENYAKRGRLGLLMGADVLPTAIKMVS
jgi:2,3-bisphosphoglycerate-independent phosphoglycerate mutase